MRLFLIIIFDSILFCFLYPRHVPEPGSGAGFCAATTPLSLVGRRMVHPVLSSARLLRTQASPHGSICEKFVFFSTFSLLVSARFLRSPPLGHILAIICEGLTREALLR